MKDNKKVKNAFSNFGNALSRLSEFLENSDDSMMDMAAVIQAFEFTYETSWHLFQKIAEEKLINALSPRDSIKAAFQLQIIDNEELWISMQKSRNLTVHTYNLITAQNIYSEIKSKYKKEFELVNKKVEALLKEAST